jgi:hypothetical protein
MADLGLFVQVLLGTDVDSQHVARADLNNDHLANGKDTQMFVAALLGS